MTERAGAAEAKEVSKKTQDDMVQLSMGLRVFMTETDDKLSGKADAKALLHKAGWSEVRDLMVRLVLCCQSRITLSVSPVYLSLSAYLSHLPPPSPFPRTCCLILSSSLQVGG